MQGKAKNEREKCFTKHLLRAAINNAREHGLSPLALRFENRIFHSLRVSFALFFTLTSTAAQWRWLRCSCAFTTTKSRHEITGGAFCQDREKKGNGGCRAERVRRSGDRLQRARNRGRSEGARWRNILQSAQRRELSEFNTRRQRLIRCWQHR